MRQEMIKTLLQHGLIINPEDVDNPLLLNTAIEKGNLEIVEALLKDGAGVNVLLVIDCSSTVQTPLHTAVKRKQVEIAKLLINYGANVNIKDGEGTTPIVYAIRNNDTDMIELLLINRTDTKGDPEILSVAAACGCLKVVGNLLKDGADVNMFISILGKSLTLLQIAVASNQVEMAKLLINNGANVNIKDDEGITPIVYAINKERDTEMFKLYSSNSADENQDPGILSVADSCGCLKVIENLLKGDADVNMYISNIGETSTLAHAAVRSEEVEMAELLINYGADVNVKDRKGKASIIYAIGNFDTEMTELLLKNGADIKDNPEALCTAVENGCLEIVEILLNYGADVNASDRYGRTALHYTVLFFNVNERSLLSYSESDLAHEEIAELLLSRGANVNAPTKRGITALCAASRKNYGDMVEILLKHGADPGAEDTKPLHAAAVGGHPRIIENLLKFGAEVDSRDIYGRTALHFAVRKGNEQCVETLLKYGSDVNVISEKNHTPLEYGRLVADDYNGIDGVDDYHYNLHYVSQTNGSRTTWLLKQHIAKMKAAGFHVSERNLLGISNGHEINNFLTECEAEIEVMKSEKIGNSCASFYDILIKNKSQLASNESIAQAMKSNDYKTKFPKYASTINRRFRRWVEREELLEQVRNKFSRFLFQCFPKLPILCAERIFSYLSDRDLGILLVACELSD